MRGYEHVAVTIEGRPDVECVIITPKRQIYVNTSAAKGAKIIWLVQNLDERPAFAVRYRP